MTKTQQRGKLGPCETPAALTRQALRTDARILRGRGYTIEQIARALGVSIGTAWTWLNG